MRTNSLSPAKKLPNRDRANSLIPVQSPANIEEELNKLEEELEAVEREIEVLTKKLKPQPSFTSTDSAIWETASKVDLKKAEIEKIRANISKLDHEQDGCLDSWDGTTEAQQYNKSIQTYEINARILKTQADRQADADEMRRARGAGMIQLYFTSTLGKRFNQKMPKREGKVASDSKQARLRKQAIELYGSDSTAQGRNVLWCPILGEERSVSDMVAAHIFPYRSGKDIMISIFGVDELTHPSNIMIISKDAEDLLEHGAIALIPDANLDSAAEASLWRLTDVKNYRLKVLDKTHKACENEYNSNLA